MKPLVALALSFSLLGLSVPSVTAQNTSPRTGTLSAQGLDLAYELDEDNWLQLYWNITDPGVLPRDAVIMPHGDRYSYILTPQEAVLPLQTTFQGKVYEFGHRYRVRPGTEVSFQLSQYVEAFGASKDDLSFTRVGGNGYCFSKKEPWDAILPSYDILLNPPIKSHGEAYQLPSMFPLLESGSFDWDTATYSLGLLSTGLPYEQELELEFLLHDENGTQLTRLGRIIQPNEWRASNGSSTPGVNLNLGFELHLDTFDRLDLDIVVDPNNKILERSDVYNEDITVTFFRDEEIQEYTDRREKVERAEAAASGIDCRIQANGVGIAYDAGTGEPLIPLAELPPLSNAVISELQASRDLEVQTYSYQGFNNIGFDFQNKLPDYPSAAGHVDVTGYYEGQEHFFPAWKKDLEKQSQRIKAYERAQRIYEGAADEAFIDVSADEWFAENVAKAFAQKVVSGKKDRAGNILHLFDPGSGVTRAELLKIGYLASGLQPGPAVGGQYPNHWSTDFWEDARSRGFELVRQGHPDDPVKRSDAVRFMVELLEIPLESDFSSLSSYTDVPKNDPLAPYVYTALKRGAIVERAQFNPDQALNRAEQLAFVYQFLAAIGR